MTDERRFQEDEVKEIFDRAAKTADVGRPGFSDGSGMTLSQLQEIGLEVGIEPERIAQAATAIASRSEVLPRRRFLGAPLSVGRIVDLPRAVTDREWDVLVGEFREAFGARGKVSSHGGIREWTNGNLQAFLEPTAEGHRLRLRTFKGSAMPAFGIGAAFLTIGLALVTLFIFEGFGRAELVIPILMTLFGSGVLASNVIKLPRWAREREGQMEYVAGRATALMGEHDEGEVPER